LRPSGATLTAALIVAATALPASAAEQWTCWSGVTGTSSGQTSTVTRCRITGSRTTTDFGSSSEVPATLRPDVGTSGDVLCWFWTTRADEWVLLGVDDDLVATLGIDPDGIAGGPIVISAEYPACTAEPSTVADPLTEAFDLLATHRHPEPDPTVDPAPGSGITGLPTYVADVPPDPWRATLVSPFTGVTIEVESRVSAVEIDWGDGTVDTVPDIAFGLLTGWPDGAFAHVYETKTCPRPGGWRCHPTLDAYPMTVRYLWTARYRAGRASWKPIVVPSTEIILRYDVDEIRGATTAVG